MNFAIWPLRSTSLPPSWNEISDFLKIWLTRFWLSEIDCTFYLDTLDTMHSVISYCEPGFINLYSTHILISSFMLDIKYMYRLVKPGSQYDVTLCIVLNNTYTCPMCQESISVSMHMHGFMSYCELDLHQIVTVYK